MHNNLLIFREQSYLFGLLPAEFENYLPLDTVWISPFQDSPHIWQYETKESAKKGYFVHPGTLFGFSNLSFSENSVIFLTEIKNKMGFGVLMNGYLTQLSEKVTLQKKMDLELVSNFPDNLPKSAFQYVQRYKRKNVLVLDLKGLIKEFDIEWPN